MTENEILLNPESEDALSAELEKEHIRPAYKFKGKELWPWSRGSKLLYGQVCDDDSVTYRALAFVFIHLRRTEKTALADMRKHVIPLVWSINDFRAAILEFNESLTDADEEEALKVMTQCFEAELKTRIKAGAPGGEDNLLAAQKKTEPTQEQQPMTASPLPVPSA